MDCLFRCCFRSRTETVNPLFIDVEEVLADAAWEAYLVTFSGFRRKCIKRKNYTIEVPTGYYRLRQKETIIKQKLLEETQRNLSMSFNNDTKMEQKYNFNVQKERTSSFQVTCHAGFSVERKLPFTLSIPTQNVKGGVEIEVRMEVSKSTCENYEEKVTISANSEIALEQQTHCTASVVMEERNFTTDFEIPMAMTLAENRALVHIKRKKTGDVVSFHSFENLATYFKDFKKKKYYNVEIEDKEVVFKIKGTVKGTVLFRYRGDLKQNKIENTGENPTAEVPNTSSSVQDPECRLSLAGQIPQVAPSAHVSAIEGVQQDIAQYVTCIAGVDCPGHQ